MSETGGRSRLAGVLLLLAGAVCVAALAAFTGAAERLLRPDLGARIEVRDLTLPQGYAVDAEAIAARLADTLNERATGSTAIRFALNEDERRKLTEIVLPRLLNTGSLSQIIERLPELAPVVASTGWRGQADVTVTNRGGDALDDVVMTMPGMLLAEGPDGTAPVSADGPGEVTYISLGTLQPGESRALTLWLDRPAAEILAAPDRVLLGAAGGVEGGVLLLGREGWTGSEMEGAPWARWLVLGVIAVAGLFALLGAGLALAPQPRLTRPMRPRAGS